MELSAKLLKTRIDEWYDIDHKEIEFYCGKDKVPNQLGKGVLSVQTSITLVSPSLINCRRETPIWCIFKNPEGTVILVFYVDDCIAVANK
ncbi:hypothetical protein ILUMI_10937 [Ignelater luminosus]|uniref:Reverse transcriptase n=1 Tax=Ignelater luminosus TaxID=2038154 RepID=A0A8K0D305_IGNLU|nr:hypothetical protein ILUMI_10937 [Ignelater luminosus]